MRPQELIPLPVRKTLGGAIERLRSRADKSLLLWSLRGDAVQCNVCGWHGLRFLGDPWHERTVCPNCRSQVRHRMLVTILDGSGGFPELTEGQLIRNKAVLHFAPERQLRERIRTVASRHVTADFDRGDCDLRLDISRMPQVETESFDVVIACDVLEHVPDDHAAFREIHRVLRPGGVAILTVPQKDPPAATEEDPGIADPAEQLRRFGQADHVRIYGDDFWERVTAAGFEITVISKDNLPGESVSRNVLHPPKLSTHPLATNFRRIYFCRKAAHHPTS